MKTIVINDNGVDVEYKLASFWLRVGARFIDTLIIIIPASIIPILPSWLYWALQHASDSQSTVGQKACGIKLMAISGRKIGFGLSTGRFFCDLFNVFTFCIGYLLCFFSRKKQCLHDMICGTVVVYSDPIKSYHMQKSTNFNQTNKSFKKKPIAITVICVILILGALSTIPVLLDNTFKKIENWYLPLRPLSGLIWLICGIGLWKMKKWAAYTFVGFVGFSELILLIAGLGSAESIIVNGIIIGVIILYIKKMD